MLLEAIHQDFDVHPEKQQILYSLTEALRGSTASGEIPRACREQQTQYLHSLPNAVSAPNHAHDDVALLTHAGGSNIIGNISVCCGFSIPSINILTRPIR